MDIEPLRAIRPTPHLQLATNRSGSSAEWEQALDAAGRRWNAWIDSAPVAAPGSGKLEVHLVSRAQVEKIDSAAGLAIALAP